ncbi:MAG TPA: cation:proton antiporter [Actinomycetes bacterium]
MTDTQTFGAVVLVVGLVGLLAILSNRLTERIKIPTPAIFLAAAAIAAHLIPDLHAPPQQVVERLVTVALVLILFDGGMHIGWKRFRAAAGAIVVVGVLGTFLCVVAAAALAHLAFGLSWYIALLVGTAVAPTDPAVVFSVLGQREVAGRSGTVLEGESGANDPVGIALMASLLAVGGLGAGAAVHITGEFLLEMGLGATFGVLGGLAVLWFMREVALPSEGLYPLRTLACALLLFGLTTVAHGSGFLAVFVAGILISDAAAPFKREIERFHSALASLGEIIAFVVLGLTVDLSVLGRTNVWVPGLVLAAVLAFVIRPVLVGLCLLPARLARNETGFILFAGLKGAVPILLGSFILAAHVADAPRLYGIIVVVVAFSVVVQGSLVPAVARLLRLPMRTVEPEPWALGVRLRDEPDGVHRLVVEEGSAAEGHSVDALAGLPREVWVAFVVRDRALLQVRGDAVLQAGDEVLVLADPSLRNEISDTFRRPRGG